MQVAEKTFANIRQTPELSIWKESELKEKDVHLRYDTKSSSTNNKVDKWNFIESKMFCASKETIKEVEGQPTEWKKMFANHVTDKGPYQIYTKIH